MGNYGFLQPIRPKRKAGKIMQKPKWLSRAGRDLKCGHTCAAREYRIERSLNNHLPGGNTQVTTNPKQPSKQPSFPKTNTPKKIEMVLVVLGNEFPPNKNLDEPNSSNHNKCRKPTLPTGPRHLELLNFSQFLLQGPHPPTQGLRITRIHRWPAPQCAGLAPGPSDATNFTDLKNSYVTKPPNQTKRLT